MAAPPLVTGATGFAGSHLVDHLLSDRDAPSGLRVAAWRHSGGRPPREHGAAGVAWQAVDLLDASAARAALETVRPSAIYHCAGIAQVGESWARSARALEVNVLGTHRLLESVRETGLRCPILVTGSALVYRQSADPIDEAHPIGPASPYAVSKLAQEMLAARAVDLPVYIARPFNHAGPRQDDSFVTSSFARQIAEVEAGLREPVLRVGNLEARRDITDVRDTVRAYTLILARGRPRRPYNVCRGKAYRVGDLLEMMVALSAASIAITVDPALLRPSDNPVVLGDASRLAAETGWQPRIPIEQTLRDLLDYWREAVNRRTAS